MDFEAELNPEQYAAVKHQHGPLLILAGAGSGKTRVITYRIAHLVQKAQVEPWRILAVTFTNKAAEEMRHRASELLNIDFENDLAAPSISTFHSLCARLLRIHGSEIGLPERFVICDDSDQLQVLRNTISKLELDMDRAEIRKIWGVIDDAKNKGLDPDALNSVVTGSDGELHAEIYAAYQNNLRQNGMLDFGDLILETGNMLASCEPVRRRLQRRWRFLMVDEFQDTNPAQYTVLKLLTGEERSLAVVGDDDQAIYPWRGATVKNILEFEEDFPDAKVVKLEQNYRSNQLILDASGAVIRHVERRRDKTLWSQRKEGDPITLFSGRSAREEANWVTRTIQTLVTRHGLDYDQCAVFYRTNAQGRIFEEQLRAVGLPYQIVGGVSFYARKEIKDVLGYLKVAVNPNNNIDLKRIINTPRRGIGARTLSKLEALVGPGGVVNSLWEAIDYVVIALGGGFSDKQRDALSVLFHLVEDLKLLIDQGVGPAELLRQVIERTDYMEHLEKSEPGTVEDRRQSLEELIEILEPPEAGENAAPPPSLFEFLEQSTLVQKVEGNESDAHLDHLGLAHQPIKLMTIHGAKGLEFDAVFVVGLEEELFPLIHDKTDQDNPDFQERMDEERRLFYVALTRARHRLFLSNARTRIVHGKHKECRSSRFLDEIPADLLNIASESFKRTIRWGWPDPSAASRAWLESPRGRKAPAPEVIDGIEYEPGALAEEPHDGIVYDVDLPAIAPRVKKSRGSLLSRRKRLHQPEHDPDADPDMSGMVIEYEPQWNQDTAHADPSEGGEDESLVGRTVSHSREGLGTILSVTGSGKMETLKVSFFSGEERTILRRFIKLM